jgi:hypothetical protein
VDTLHKGETEDNNNNNNNNNNKLFYASPVASQCQDFEIHELERIFRHGSYPEKSFLRGMNS